MRKTVAVWMLAALMLLGAVAAADGPSVSWVSSRSGQNMALAAYVGDYNGWVDIAGLGGVTMSEAASVRVISRNASVWEKPQTNSGKLGSAQNGEQLSCEMDANGGYVMQDGFYAVKYKNRQGWINSAYVVAGPLEIVLMESNVPAYCAPNRNSKRVGSLAKLTRYTVLGFYNDFYVVSLREAAAFIPMSVRHYDSTFERYFHAGIGGQGTASRKTTVRTGPGSNYASVRDMNAGTSFTYMDVINGWCIMTDKDSGCYVYVDAADTDVAH